MFLSEEPNPLYYQTYKDGSLFRRNLDPNLLTIYLQIYADDVKVANVKFLMSYFTILNLPVYMQSAIREIFQLLICRRAFITNFHKSTNIERFFSGFIAEVKEIQQNPISIDLAPGKKVTVRIFQFAGDMPATNECMKITRCMTLDCCKFCNLVQNEYKRSIDWLDQPIARRKLPNDHLLNEIVDDGYFQFFFPFKLEVEIRKL